MTENAVKLNERIKSYGVIYDDWKQIVRQIAKFLMVRPYKIRITTLPYQSYSFQKVVQKSSKSLVGHL
jgi:hypothetical protein